MSDPSGTLLTTVGSRAEAEMLCGTLRANGIKCGYVLGNIAGAITMGTSGASNVGPVDVFVEDEKLEEARKLLPADG
jgi:Putative prokaryotic signal transducing protein